MGVVETPGARAAVMTAPGADLEMHEYPLPEVPPRGILVRVRCCTICRSDLHTWLGRRPGPTPAILGHEIVGSVVALGAEAGCDASDQPLQLGDRVTWTLHSCCGRCHYCRDRQLPMKCGQLRKYGHDACDQPPHLQGGFAEYCLLDEGTGVVKLPDNLSDLEAAPANCAVATIVAGYEAAQLQPGENVLIQGAGALGCYAAAFAAHAGAARVIAIDVDSRRLENIRRYGATDCVDSSQCAPQELIGQIKSLTGGFGADCAMELAGVPSIVEQGLAALRKGGRYIEIGCSFPDARASIDMSLILWNLLTVRGVHNYDVRHLRQAVGFLSQARSRFPFAELVGAEFPLEQINEAMRLAEEGVHARVAVVCT